MRIFRRLPGARYGLLWPWMLSCSLLFCLFWSSGQLAFAAQSPGQPQRQVLRGHLIPALQGKKMQGPTGHNQTLKLTIGLQLRNQVQLQALLAAQNDPHSLWYKHYLTPQQFAEEFSPTQDSVNQLVSYLRSMGLRVTNIPTNRLLVDVTGSVGEVEQAFDMQIGNYTYEGQHVYAPVDEPSVPESLSGLISGIEGLDDVAHYHHLSIVLPAQPGKAQDGPGGGLTPTQLRTAYDVNPLISAGYNGTGQTVAIVEFEGYQPSDVNEYLSYYNLGSPKYSNVLIDGASAAPTGGVIEAQLDMEVMSAVAPGANQLIYIGGGANDLYNQIVTDDRAKVTSISWGLCEADSGSGQLSALDNIFQEGAAQGQAFFAASGDSGAYDCGGTSLAVDSPADDPYVMGVGGTYLQTDNNGDYQGEIAWSCTTCTSSSTPEGAGGGGGISSYFGRPAYQVGNGLTSGNRMVPDVSSDASHGSSMYCTVASDNCPSSGWINVGGTSAAAPLWSAVATDINQYLTSQGRAPLGDPHSAFYNLYNNGQAYAPFHDVTSGNNLYYQAGPGYDLATGLGSADAWNIARDIAGTSGQTGPIHGPGGKCVDVQGANATDGTPVQLYDCNGTNAQNWTIASDGSLRALGKCLDITGQGTTPGTKVQLWDCWGGANQKWVPQANGSLLNPVSGLCLDDPAGNTADGTQLQIWTCNNLWPQVYQLPGYPALGAIGAPGGKCVDDAGANPTDGTPVQLWDCNGTKAQIWTMESNHTIEVQGKCLDIIGNVTTLATKLDIWDCNGSGGQQWIPQSNGSLLNPQSGLCLDDPAGNTADGTQLQIWTCNNLWPQVYQVPS